MSSKTQLSGHILHPGMDSSWFADGAHRASMRALSVPEPLPNIQTIYLHRQGRPEAPPGTYFPAWSAPSCDLNPVHIWSRFNGLWGDTPVGSDLINNHHQPTPCCFDPSEADHRTRIGSLRVPSWGPSRAVERPLCCATKSSPSGGTTWGQPGGAVTSKT